MSVTSEKRKRIKVLADAMAREYQANLAKLGQEYADSRALEKVLIWADPSSPGSAWPYVHAMLLALMEVHPGIQRHREAERRADAARAETS